MSFNLCPDLHWRRNNVTIERMRKSESWRSRLRHFVTGSWDSTQEFRWKCFTHHSVVKAKYEWLESNLRLAREKWSNRIEITTKKWDERRTRNTNKANNNNRLHLSQFCFILSVCCAKWFAITIVLCRFFLCFFFRTLFSSQVKFP